MHQHPPSRIEWGQHREKDGDQEMEEDILAGEARTLDDSLGYILAVIGSVLLSYKATALQRDGVCLALAGDDAGAQDAQARVRRVRLLSGAVLIGALGYFLCLALRAVDQCLKVTGLDYLDLGAGAAGGPAAVPGPEGADRRLTPHREGYHDRSGAFGPHHPV